MNVYVHIEKEEFGKKKKKSPMVFKLSQLWILRYIYIHFGRMSAKLFATG